MRAIARFFGFVFATGAIVFVIAAAIVAAVIFKFEQDLPDYSQLKNYEPPVMTRVHASDGSLLAEYARERRLYLPSAAIPQLVKNAFIAAEDKNFYTHRGFDPEGILRAAYVFLQGSKRVQGASTITQQVAKNFLLTADRTIERKIREILLSMRIESAYSKDKILELYLNEIYLGLSNYGVAAAALNYFNKSVHELSIAEVAYLAALPKEPSDLNPFRNHDRAIERRNYVIGRMEEDHYITAAQAKAARSEPLTVNPRALTPDSIAAGFFAEEVRRELKDRYGEQKLYEGGLSVRTTLDPKMQLTARKALVDGLVRYDEAHGWHGTVKTIDLGQDWGVPLGDLPEYADIKPWRLAVVLDVSDTSIRIGLQPEHDKTGALVSERETGTVTLDGAKWTGTAPQSASQVGGTSSTSSPSRRTRASIGCGKFQRFPARASPWILLPAACWRWWADSPTTSPSSIGRPKRSASPARLSSRSSTRRRSTTATRRLRSSSTLRSRSIRATAKIWKPENFEGKSEGPHTLRFGIEHSINQMTVRLARDIGMPLIVEYAKRFGIYDNLPPFSVDVARRRRNDGSAYDNWLFDVRKRRQAHQGDFDRPDPGSLG